MGVGWGGERLAGTEPSWGVGHQLAKFHQLRHQKRESGGRLCAGHMY